MKVLPLIVFYCLLTVSKTAFGTDYLTIEQLPSAVKQHNSHKVKQKITSLHTYRVFRHHIEGALSIEDYQTRYGVTREDLAKKIFGNMEHLSLEQLPNSITKHNTTNSHMITSLASYIGFYPYYIKGALAPETYQILYGITEEEFVKQVFGSMEHLSLEQLPNAITKYNTANSKKIISLASYIGFHPYIRGALALETYQILYGISEEKFVKQVFGSMEHLSLEQLPNAITKYNTTNRNMTFSHMITSLASYIGFHLYIEGALTPETYQILYGISEEKFVKQVFGSMEHVTPSQPSRSIEEDFLRRIKGMIRGRRNTSNHFYNIFNHIRDKHNESNSDILVFAPETYQTLYGVSARELLKQFFKKAGVDFTLDQLPRILEEYNNNAEKKITSLSSYNDFESNSKNISDIDLTPTFKDYQWLYGVSKEEFVKQVFGNMEHLSLEQLPNAITKHNTTNSHMITSLASYIDIHPYTKGALALAPETYQILYGITEEEFVKQVFGNMEHLFLEQLPNAIAKHNNTTQSAEKRITSIFHFGDARIGLLENIFHWHIPRYTFITITGEHRYMDINNSPSHGLVPRKYIHIPGALSFATYAILYGITAEEFVKQVFGNMEHLSLKQQLPNAIVEYNKNADKSEKVTSTESFIRHYHNIPGALDYITYDTLYAITAGDFIRSNFTDSRSIDQFFDMISQNNSQRASEREFYSLTKEKFIKSVFGNMEHLSLEKLPNAIREHNNQSSTKITSFIHSYHDYYTQIPGALSFETYAILYGITEEEFVKLVLKQSVKILTLEQLPNAIKKHNKKSRSITSFERYQKHRHLIPGALSFETYQRIHGITEKEFVKQVFGNMEHLSLEQLSNAIRKEKHINSFSTFQRRPTQIPGALSFETYQILYGITEEEFVELVFRNTRTGRSTAGSSSRKAPETNNKIENLTLEQLPTAIEEHNKKKYGQITSFERYQKHRHRIAGALSFEEYQTSYKITKEEFVRKVFGSIENLTLEQLPTAIEEHNKKRYGQITSFERYQKHRHRIAGALSFEEYQTSYKITKEEFVRKVFGSIEHLTPNQLSDTIREFRTRQGTRIGTLPMYRQLHTQIKGALAPETYQTLYGISEEEFFKLIQNRCETEFQRL